MPDLHSELKKLENLQFDDEPQSAAPAGGSINARIFYFIKDNPDCTCKDIAQALSLDAADVATRMTGFAERKLVSRERNGLAYCYRAAVETYPEHDRLASLAKAQAARSLKAARRRAASLRQARQERPTPAPKAAAQPTPAVQPHDVKALLNTLPIATARALYDELRKIFGG